MKLVSAEGSYDMQSALSHRYVIKIVAILLQDRDLLRPVAKLLQKHTISTPPRFEEELTALLINQSRPDAVGNVFPPDHVVELTHVLRELYRQSEQKIGYQRGAILELLAKKYVCSRYGHGEFCLSNQRFVDQGKPITIKQVDVAALSHSRHQVEGYSCKIKINSLESSDCTDLAYLAKAAQERDYRAIVGVISFDNDMIVKLKLNRLGASESIKIYGLDSIEILRNTPFE